MDGVVWPSGESITCTTEDMASDSLVEAWFMICWGHLGHLMGAAPVGAQGQGGQMGQILKVAENAR